jgi:hypothetical protein
MVMKVVGLVVLAGLAFVSIRMLSRSWRRAWRESKPPGDPRRPAG